MGERFRFDPAEVAVCADGHLPEALDLRERELHVEIGFGKDIRVLRQAERSPDSLFLGIEISRKKALSFCRKVARAGLRNIRCFHGDVRKVLESGMLPPGRAASFTILFPDPWPKRRHRKHRWIQAGTAALLARALAPGGTVVVATDHEGYREQIREALSGAGLELGEESTGVPDADRTLFAERFLRRGEGVTWQRWRKGAGGAAPPSAAGS
ncbi:MAG: tRNA (guanine(46)-N(7))-methyltransferase TrmB [Planctomycetota bacterium]|jgi:tRNA (guanine-N7-)-methyltransferase